MSSAFGEDSLPLPLKGSKALVVGGGSGIGEAGAQALAAYGARVTIAGRSAKRLAAAAARVHAPVDTCVVDARDPQAIAQMFESIGSLDHLVITLTGKMGSGYFREVDLDEFRQAYEEKFWPHLMLAQASLKTISSEGSITFVTGISARKTTPGGSGYVAVNGALEVMVPTLAYELAPLRVNAISPGFVDTPWYDHIPAAEMKVAYRQATETLPVKRIGRPDDLGQAIAFVVTNGFTTGAVIECDGGARLIRSHS